MGRIILISYTPINSPGGVPRWNRDFISCFPGTIHYSWWDCSLAYDLHPEDQRIPEWKKSKLLSNWLLAKKLVTSSDVVIGDNWWVDGLEHLPMCCSVQHGNWSHTTKDDVDNGVPPEFPEHAAKQLEFRRRYLAAGRKLVTVSRFIQRQMKLQWGFDSTVINNGIDVDAFKPAAVKLPREKPIIVHFSTTANKGLDHIEHLRRSFGKHRKMAAFARLDPLPMMDADLWLLDEAAERLKLPKYEALAQADLVVHPSAHEGNSLAVAESLACNVPVVSYDVGLMFQAREDGTDRDVGEIMDRRERSPERTVDGVADFFFRSDVPQPRVWAIKNKVTLVDFHRNWKEYLNVEFGIR